MSRKIWIALVVLIAVSLSCSFSKDKKETKESAQQAPTTQQAPTNPPPQEEAQPTQEEEVSEPSEEAEVEEEASDASDAPRFFRDDFEGPLDEENWESLYSYVLPDGVEEGDEEAEPVYSIEQERGALKFNLESQYLYLYHMYTPHLYQDVRIDIEVENKGVNTNNISLVCRSTDYGWYEFIATSGGYYSIMRYYEDGSDELATGGIRSIKFGVNKKNVFTAICKKKTLTYIVNGVEIAKVRDEEIMDEGNAGINVSAEDVVPVNVEVNWLEISEP